MAAAALRYSGRTKFRASIAARPPSTHFSTAADDGFTIGHLFASALPHHRLLALRIQDGRFRPTAR